jgi:hypothetical protein
MPSSEIVDKAVDFYLKVLAANTAGQKIFFGEGPEKITQKISLPSGKIINL